MAGYFKVKHSVFVRLRCACDVCGGRANNADKRNLADTTIRQVNIFPIVGAIIMKKLWGCDHDIK